jgi:predicted aspartyl protease
LDFRALTTRFNGVARVLELPVKIAPPVVGSEIEPARTRDCKGIWDTGATGSVISQTVVDDLGLKPIGMTQVHTANGSAVQPVYMISLLLPNGVNVNTSATQANVEGCDVLVGMDVISLGDFSVTNLNGKTMLSFRIPSCDEIDYVKQAKKASALKAAKAPISGDSSSRWERRHPGKRPPSNRHH